MQQIDMADNAEHQLLAALLTSEIELPQLTSLLQSNTKPEASSVKRKRKRDSAPVVHRETASQHKVQNSVHNDVCCTACQYCPYIPYSCE